MGIMELSNIIIVHHQIGSLLPSDGSSPKYLQLYIYDTANEVQNRLKCLNSNNMTVEVLDPSIIEELIKIIQGISDALFFQKRGLPHAQIIFWVSNETSQSSKLIH
ncbi:hypothetical protein ACJX0J_022815 [Zea mays]